MKKSSDWQTYIDTKGDFELPAYMFKTLMDLMKTSLDLGTLLCDDPAKLRAYKERIKTVFKQRWMDMAQALEFFDIIIPCECNPADYCTKCSGSRYLLSSLVAPDKATEIAVFFSGDSNNEVAMKLREGLASIMQDVN